MNQNTSGKRVAVVGATGLVGRVMARVLAEREFPVAEFIPVASARSVGTEVEFKGDHYKVIGMEEALAMKLDIALFSAGGGTSKLWAPKFAEVGTTVIDNSSAWRMEEGIPLVVPEVNGQILNSENLVIANPNCSTIQLVVALHPLNQRYGLERVIVSTYQSVTGTGKQAVDQLRRERVGQSVEDPAYPHQIDMNCIPHCDVFEDSGYTREEMKLQRESRKIMGIPDLPLTATAVRVPVQVGHSESVNLTLREEFDIDELRDLLTNSPGIKVIDDPASNSYPMPNKAEHQDWVYVGRIRRDDSFRNSLNMWIVSDNLRKGAATNAVQIAELLERKFGCRSKH